MRDKNFTYEDFSPRFIEEIKKVVPGMPRLILSDNEEIDAVIIHPDEYASMCDQIAFAQLLSLAVKRLTGIDDPAKLSMEDFLKVCELDDQYLESECEKDD